MAGTASDAGTILLEKTSMLGRYFSGFAIRTAAISILAHSESNSSLEEFTQNAV